MIETTIIENNNLEYELDICEKFNSLMLAVNIKNRLLFENCYNKLKGVNPNYGILKGCGLSKTTCYYNRKRKAIDLESCSVGSVVTRRGEIGVNLNTAINHTAIKYSF